MPIKGYGVLYVCDTQAPQVLQEVQDKLKLKDPWEILESQVYLEHWDSLVFLVFQEKKAFRPISTTTNQ